MRFVPFKWNNDYHELVMHAVSQCIVCRCQQVAVFGLGTGGLIYVWQEIMAACSGWPSTKFTFQPNYSSGYLGEGARQENWDSDKEQL